MPLPIHCKACGFRSTGVDALAGKTVKCRECGALILVPLAAVNPYDPAAARPAPASPPLRFGPAPPPRPAPPRQGAPARRAESDDSGRNLVLWMVGGLAAFVVLAVITLAVILAGGVGSNGTVATISNARTNAASTPIAIQATLPAFPEVGPGALIEPGIMLHEIHLPQSPLPGHRGKLWLYLPSGAHPDGSLPCVMITGAGSNLLSGMDLGDGDRAEHLPYVRAGFAVLAYELDGKTDGNAEEDARRGYDQFRAAQAGLVNARIALEFLLAKVPAVDRGRIFSAGHSSAGTLSLLFAEHEPRLAGSIAYAPAIDLEARFGGLSLMALGANLPDVRDFVARHSPRNHEAGFTAPVFLFHAEDDSNVPVSATRDSAERLSKLGKSVTLEVVPTGEHYDSMIQQGIPRAIAWLKSHKTGQSTPPPPPPAPIATTPQPAPFIPASPPPPTDVPFSVAPPVTTTTPPGSGTFSLPPRR